MTRNFSPPPPTTDEINRICREVLGCLPTNIETLRSGAWSSATGLETDRGPKVLRFSATDEDFRADAHASQFAVQHLPIPQVAGIGQLNDRWWCLSQRMPGVHLDELSTGEMTHTLPSLAAMLRSMSRISADDSSGYGGWDAAGNGRFASFADQLLDVAVDDPSAPRGGGWSERLREHPQALKVFDDGLRQLQSLVHVIPDVRQLIHQDTINFNVTVDEDRISGIFDWGCAMWGDALYDLAWFRFWNPWYPQWASVNVPDQLEQLVGIRGAHASDRMHCYLLHIGLGHIRYNAHIENWVSMAEVMAATKTLLRNRHT